MEFLDFFLEMEFLDFFFRNGIFGFFFGNDFAPFFIWFGLVWQCAPRRSGGAGSGSAW
jgi:hypothetical protein